MEWISAWRGVRARGRSAAFVIGLLALAIASNAVMFSFADSLVFRRDPFPGADRVFSLPGQAKAPQQIDHARSALVRTEWKRQTDLVSAIGTYYRKNVFIRGDGGLEKVRTADVTVGFLEMLGAAPRWGRGFTPGDDTDPGAFAVLIGEDLARRRFGTPSGAVGQVLDATAGKHVVVGVMDESFIFPDASYQMWRALDPVGPLVRNFGSMSPIVRLAAGVPIEDAVRLLTDRAAQVGASSGLSTYTVRPAPYFRAPTADRRTMVLMLLGAALSLLLAACANVASIELANAARKARTAAVHMALGASRWSLARVAAIEGVMFVGSAFAIAIGLIAAVMNVLRTNLPDTLRLTTANRIDLDSRTLVAMLAFAALAWIVGVLPMVWTASRPGLNLLLKAEDRGASGSRRTAWVRQALTLVQVAFAVALISGSVFFVSSYRNLLAVEKGFDSRGLYSVSWSLPATESSAPLRERALAELRAAPGIEAVTTSPAPPSVGDSPSEIALEIGGRQTAEKAFVGRNIVDADYFKVVGLPIKQGNVFGPSSLETDVVIPQSFARRYFPAGDAVGQTFRRSSNDPWLTVIGVVGDFRTERTHMPEPGEELFHYAMARSRLAPAASTPLAPPATAPPPVPTAQIDTGGSFRILTLTVRASEQTSAASLLGLLRKIDPTLPVVSSVGEQYARQNADARLASQIVGIFGAFAFAIAITGVLAVMVFIVSSRSREIGIRMALGADAIAVQRMVLGASLRMVSIGLVLGLALALAGSRAVESLLFGVSPMDANAYLMSVAGVLVAAIAATWLPARQAARVDPAVTLRHD